MELGIAGLSEGEEIGVGASAVVYRARQIGLDRDVAVKLLSVSDPAFIRRFNREAKTLGRLSRSSGIVTIYDSGVNRSNQPYLILELCESSLLDKLEESGKLDPIDACEILAEVADAVAEAHEFGVVHRDLKPANVLISPDGKYLVTDFGISTVSGTTTGQTNSVGFTAGYVAPETILGTKVGPAADVYGLGATLFHLVRGETPFSNPDGDTNLLALVNRIASDPLPDLRAEGIPDAVASTIELAMSKDPERRPSASALAEQLRAVVAGQELPPVAEFATQVINDPPEDQPVGDPSGELTDEQIEDQADDRVDVEAAVSGELDKTLVVDPETEAPDPVTLGTGTGDPALAGAALAGTAAADTALADTALAGAAASGPLSLGDGGHSNEYGQQQMAGVGSEQSNGLRGAIADVMDRQGTRRTAALVAVVGLIAVLGLGFLVTRPDDQTVAADSEEVASPTADADGNSEADDSSTPADGGNDAEAGVSESASFGPTGPPELRASLDGLPDVEVPNVVGTARSRAIEQLEAVGFRANVILQQSSSVAAGRVISQDPGAGGQLPEGSLISIAVSTGNDGPAPAPTVAVPTVANSTPEAAAATIGAEGLSVAKSVEIHNPVAAGLVVGTDPPAGTQVNEGTSVTLFVSLGELVDCETVAVSVAGRTASAARAAIAALPCPVGADRFEPNASVATGLVIRADRSGDTFLLVVSSGSSTCGLDPSSFVGDSIGDVRSTVSADTSCTLVEAQEASESVAEGIVIRASKSGGTVTAVVSSGTTTCASAPTGLIGLTEAAAVTRIEAAGCTAGPSNGSPSEQTPGTVLDVSFTPPNVVILTIAEAIVGEPCTAAPAGLVGLSEGAAIARIQTAGCTVGALNGSPSEEAPGTVLDVSFSPPNVVSLTVAELIPPEPCTAAPAGLIGLSEGAAIARIQTAGCTVGALNGSPSEQAPGTVLDVSFSPPNVVSLTVAELIPPDPCTAAPAGLVGLSEAAAIARIQAAGCTVGSSNGSPSDQDPGTVIDVTFIEPNVVILTIAQPIVPEPDPAP